MPQSDPTPSWDNSKGYTRVQLKDGSKLLLKGEGLTTDQVKSGVSKWRAGQHPSHGVSGSWTTPDPGAIAGMRESAGIPSYAETKAFAKKVPSYLMHPTDSAKKIASSIEETGKAIYAHPGEFAANFTNIPQTTKAVKEHHYLEATGLGLGTAIQVLAAFSGEESLLAKSARGFRAGWEGKSAEEFTAGEKMLREAKVAQATETSRALEQSTKIRLTPGERLAGGKLEKAEQVLRGFPGLSGPFDKLARERTQAVLAFRRSIDESSQVLREQSQNLYKAIETRVPGFEATQRQVSDLREAESDAWRRGDAKTAHDIGINRKAAEDASRELVMKQGDSAAVEAWRRADNMWARHRAQQRVMGAIEQSTKGLRAGTEEKIGAASRAQVVHGGTLVERLKKLEKGPDGNVLARAVGESRAAQLKSVASLLDRITRRGHGYIAERVLGYAVLGAVPFVAHSYIWELAAGAAGGRLLEGVLMRFGGKTEHLKGFLAAVDSGEIRKATRLANSLVEAHVAEEQRRAAAEAAKARRMAETRTEAPTSPYRVPGEPRSGLRVADVPVQMEPGPFERPLEDQLGKLVEDLRKEGDEGRELEQHLHDALEEEMEKIRQRSRTQGAMQQYRGR